MDLTTLGWTPERDRDFAELRAAGFFPARVSVSYGSSCIVWAEQGELSATVAGRLKLDRDEEAVIGHPVVGDWVALRPADGTGAPLVHCLLPRRTAFIRKVAGFRTKPQVVAANIDRTFIVTSANRDFNSRRLERYLTLARESGAEPVVVLSKTDLAGDELAGYLEEAQTVSGDTPIHLACAISGEGVEQLTQYLLPATTVAFLGSSGVGKSTLINLMLGHEYLRTQEVRDDDRGRHTTSHRELMMLPSGALVIDTPGMRELQLWDAGEGGFEEAFEDIQKLAENCKFRDCAHHAEPGCAVRGAAESGGLEPQRLGSYLQLQEELKAAGIRKTELGRAERKHNQRVEPRPQTTQRHHKSPKKR